MVICVLAWTAAALVWAAPADAGEGEDEVKKIVAAYAADHDVGKARTALERVVTTAPDLALPRFHLAILAEKERRWAQAAYWFEEYLRLDSASALAAKIRQELAHLQRVQAFETSALGAEHAQALELLDQTRADLRRQQTAAAAEKVYDVFRLNPKNWDVQLATAEVLVSNQSFALAEAMLITVWEQAPAAKKLAIEKALLQCQRERQYVEQKNAADALLRDKKTGAAAAAYLTAWEAAPQHTEIMALALQCAIIAEDYPLAHSILEKLQAAKRTGTPMPPVFQDCAPLLAKVDALKAFKDSPKLASNSSSRTGTSAPASTSSTKKSASPAKKNSGTSKSGGMARDFLNRTKK